MRARTGAALAALALAGCGGDDEGSSDEDKIKSAIKDYATAVKDSDQPKACNLLSDQVKIDLEEMTGRQCQSYVTNLASAGTGQDIEKVEATEATVDGSSATATVKGVGGIELEVDMVKEGVEWKIADAEDADLGTEVISPTPGAGS